MNRSGTGILLLSAACSLIGCGSTPKKMPTPPPPLRTIQLSRDLPVIYHRTGGFAGVDERLVIWPDGLVQRESDSVAVSPPSVSKMQHEIILSLLERCHVSPAPGPNGAMDVFYYTIQHGGQTISTDDVNMSAEVRDLVREIERAVQGDATTTTTSTGSR